MCVFFLSFSFASHLILSNCLSYLIHFLHFLHFLLSFPLIPSLRHSFANPHTHSLIPSFIPIASPPSFSLTLSPPLFFSPFLLLLLLSSLFTSSPHPPRGDPRPPPPRCGVCGVARTQGGHVGGEGDMWWVSEWWVMSEWVSDEWMSEWYVMSDWLTDWRVKSEWI